MQRFREFFQSHTDVSEAEWEQIKARVKIRRYKKGDTIHNIGDVFREMLFINKGLLRSYFIDENGRDFTWQLHFAHPKANLKNLFVLDYASFSMQQPSLMTIEALSDSELYAISFEDREALYALDPKWERFGRKVCEEVYAMTYYRTVSLLTQSAKERYEQLLAEAPELFEVAPQHYIASYLGIAPQSLSRMKHRQKQSNR